MTDSSTPKLPLLERWEVWAYTEHPLTRTRLQRLIIWNHRRRAGL